MRKTEVALMGAAAAIMVAIGIPVAPAAGQEFANNALFDSQPVETAFEIPSPMSLESVGGPESDMGGYGCVEEDGSVSLHSSLEERAAMGTECPEWVALDDFEDIDYGGGIGVTMCRLTEEYSVKTGASALASFGAKIKAIFTGEVEAKVWGETLRSRCAYHGCDLDISQSEANWAVHN